MTGHHQVHKLLVKGACCSVVTVPLLHFGMRVSEKRVLRRMFGPKRAEATRGWRKLHNEDLHNMYPSPNMS
jgi:hypothetical protein